MKRTTTRLRLGMRVRWADPDPIEGCPNVGVIVHLQHNPPMDDSVIGVSMDDGGYAEALPHELTPLLEGSKARHA